MMLVVPNLLVTLQIIICPIGRRAACSLRVDNLRSSSQHLLPTISTVGKTLRTSHIPPLSRSDLVPWHNSDSFGRLEQRNAWPNHWSRCASAIPGSDPARVHANAQSDAAAGETPPCDQEYPGSCHRHLRSKNGGPRRCDDDHSVLPGRIRHVDTFGYYRFHGLALA
jgi:hypothetical protein